MLQVHGTKKTARAGYMEIDTVKYEPKVNEQTN